MIIHISALKLIESGSVKNIGNLIRKLLVVRYSTKMACSHNMSAGLKGTTTIP